MTLFVFLDRVFTKCQEVFKRFLTLFYLWVSTTFIKTKKRSGLKLCLKPGQAGGVVEPEENGGGRGGG